MALLQAAPYRLVNVDTRSHTSTEHPRQGQGGIVSAKIILILVIYYKLLILYHKCWWDYWPLQCHSKPLLEKNLYAALTPMPPQRPLPEYGCPKTSSDKNHAAIRLPARFAWPCEMSKSAEILNRSRSLRTIVRLSSRLPLRTSLTRLGVPSTGTMSARERPC
jgi:hypothetical protein